MRSVGGVSEWFKEAVLKTVVPKGTVGSNPTPSATGMAEQFITWDAQIFIEKG